MIQLNLGEGEENCVVLDESEIGRVAAQIHGTMKSRQAMNLFPREKCRMIDGLCIDIIRDVRDADTNARTLLAINALFQEFVNPENTVQSKHPGKGVASIVMNLPQSLIMDAIKSFVEKAHLLHGIIDYRNLNKLVKEHYQELTTQDPREFVPIIHKLRRDANENYNDYGKESERMTYLLLAAFIENLATHPWSTSLQ